MDGLALTLEQAASLTLLKQIVEEDDQAVLAPPCEAQCDDCPGATPLSMRAMTDEQLTAHLQMHGWDVRKAAYTVLVYKARNSDIGLPSGLKLPDQSAHYLRLASLQRKPQSGMLLRIDEPRRGD